MWTNKKTNLIMGYIGPTEVVLGKGLYGVVPCAFLSILKYLAICQMLYVRIGDHVEIGANTCIDRGR